MEQTHNPTDKITLDVPLFIRLLEYAREDAKTDMDLHNVAEKAVAASETGKTLTMSDYDALVAGNSEDKEMNEIKRMIELANIKTFFQ
jgi:TfoX/Sxy family transcriptional regulator of competence genes